VAFANVPPYHERNVLEEIREAEASGAIRFDPDGNLIVPGMPPGGSSYQHPPPILHHSPHQAGGDTAPKPSKRSTSPPPGLPPGGHSPYQQHSPYRPDDKEDIFFEAPDVARSAHLQPDLVIPSSAAVATGPDIAKTSPAGKSPPQVVQDSQQRFNEPPAQAKQLAVEKDEGDFDDELDLDLDQLDLNIDEGGAQVDDDEFNLNED